MKHLISLCFLPILLAACAGAGDGGGDDAARGPIGKADLVGSCSVESVADQCGGSSPDGCWCDDACADFGDCCGDNRAACDAMDIVFSRDLRPVDGTLKELRLRLDDNGAWEATLRTAFFDRIEGKEVDATETLASGLDCIVGDGVQCSRDLRPVDGALVELDVARNAHDSFDATLHREFFDRINGEVVTETDTLAMGLFRQDEVQLETLTFARDLRPVDGALTEIFLAETSPGIFDVSVHTNFFNRIEGKEVDENELVASGLPCEVGVNVHCERDMRPVDGALTVLDVDIDQLGRYTATLRTAHFDRIAGEEVRTEAVLGAGLMRQ